MKKLRARTTAATALALAVVASLVTTAAQASGSPDTLADIRADVNRDGVVDVTGDSDVAGENTWTSQRGAIFLPNIGDKHRRCETRKPDGSWLSNARLEACDDAQGNVVRAPEYLASLRTLPVADATDAATGSLRLIGPGASKVRLFLKRNGGWSYVRGTDRITAAELRAGLRLGIDARDVIREDWDGRITVRFTLRDRDRTSADDVMLRVAPVLTNHHLQRVEQALTVAGGRQDPNQRRFVREFAREVRNAGITEPVYTFGDGSDIWAQDFVEPGYVSMPGPGGEPRVLRVMIRSAQMDRGAGKQAFDLRGPGVGVVQVNEGVYDQINSTGNLETIPPYTHGGESFPAGRIITGRHGSTLPAHTDFLRAQGAQDPLLLDTGWLFVGHVDEFVQFLPADTPRGWKIGLADPTAGIELLRQAQRDGHGETEVLSIPSSYPTDFSGSRGEIPTIDETLADAELIEANALAARKIEENLAILKRETGVTDAEIVRVPVVYDSLSWDDLPEQRSGAAPTDQQAVETVIAFVPDAVNGVVLNEETYLAPQQWGPVINGRDIFADAVTTAYAEAGMRVRFLDDWRTQHLFGGEVHCGTNTIRAADTGWWDAPTAVYDRTSTSSS